MLEITTRLKVRRDVYQIEVGDRLILPFDVRQKSRFRTVLESGSAVGVFLSGNEILRGGDLLVASDGRVVEVVAQSERVMQATCATPYELARAAYHLGNRHVALQIGDGWLRIADDHVLGQMLEGLGLGLSVLEAPFEPEKGAYGKHQHNAGHHHHHDDMPATHGGVIHQFGEYAGTIKPGHDAVREPSGGHVHSPGGEHVHPHDHAHSHDEHRKR